MHNLVISLDDGAGESAKDATARCSYTVLEGSEPGAQDFAFCGNPFGQSMLGLMYDKGHGVPQDHAEAAKWYFEETTG